MNGVQLPQLMSNEQLIALHQCANKWDSKVAGLDHAWNVYQYLGATVATIPEAGRLMIYKIAKERENEKQQQQQQFFMIPECLVIIESRIIDGVRVEAHLLSRRRDERGEPVIVFSSESENTSAILPVQKAIAETIVLEKRDDFGRPKNF